MFDPQKFLIAKIFSIEIDCQKTFAEKTKKTE
jgi:hypothetical protein